LNEIYLGSGNYGVASAALNYFDRSLGELSRNVDDSLVNALSFGLNPAVEFIEPADGEAVEQRPAIERVRQLELPVTDRSFEVP